VPWLLQQCEPKASGAWHLAHVIEVNAPADARKQRHGSVMPLSHPERDGRRTPEAPKQK
jgi:hypothetical protein